MLKAKSAFTLAEILITVTIIGVLAVVLIPRTLSNANAVSAHNKFTMSFVQIQNGINVAKNNNNESLFEIKESNITNTMDEVTKYFQRHLNAKAVTDEHPALQTAIGTNGKAYQLPTGAWLVIPNSTATLMNGTGCLEYTTITSARNLSNRCVMYIDINGKKGPNVTIGTVATSNGDDAVTDSTGACSSGTYKVNTRITEAECVVSNDALFDIYPIIFEKDNLLPYSNAVAYILENKKN